MYSASRRRDCDDDIYSSLETSAAELERGMISPDDRECQCLLEPVDVCFGVSM